MSPHPAPEGRLDVLVDMSDAVRDLTTSQLHVELFLLQDAAGRPVKNERHIRRHPSLLNQLRAAGAEGSRGDASMATGYESRPAARLDALDVLLEIERSADDWLVRRFGVDVRPTVEDNLRLLLGLAAQADNRLRSHLARDITGWLTLARVVSGWDSSPWRPNAGCPACEQVGGLRVRLDERNAACLHCKESWTADTIGILAEHLREVNANVRTRRQQAARLRADLDGFFPYRGPCLDCIHPPAAGLGRQELAEHTRRYDARHRLIDEVVGLVLSGEHPDLVAVGAGLPVEAVHVAVAVATWPADLERQGVSA